ncbi:Gfo/Idh/MocA family protein [Tsukamurella strandjordii]|uniref:Gfo/Idh/MocA family oxidoreductase n=1 Tax=Tsukamurella strandjordii TaxID=147577 RepID=A0AA90SSQ0_9ACTN|nr:Gfo/Idh/MocA family oxidoreductase [Tsukamurella strandjordii]MDP0400071.1 Gfo/Idh/MocA family oxidoreductase [Tsukamurella strandjordii]
MVRYFPEYVAIKQAADDGLLGDLAVLRFSRSSGAPAAGSWFFDEELSGGIVMDQMLHDLDQARWIAGPITSVYAAQAPASIGGKTPDAAAAHVTLTHASGAISLAQGLWGARSLPFATSVEVAGSAGVLRHSSAETRTATRVGSEPPAGYLPAGDPSQSPYLLEIRDLAEAIVAGTEPRVSTRDGVIAIALAQAASESIASGRPVAFDEALL